MTVSLSVKNVPAELAQRLRARAERNRRSLQRELLAILEAAADEHGALVAPTLPPRNKISIEELAARARERFPNGTESSVAYIREMRDSR
jgi:plasmid stability protein